MIITYKGWDTETATGERTGEETFTRVRYGRDALGSLEAIRIYVNLELISVQRGDRECIRCHCDLSDVMGVYVFVGGKCAPDRTTQNGPDIPQVLLCTEHGSNGANNLSQAAYAALMAFYEVSLRFQAVRVHSDPHSPSPHGRAKKRTERDHDGV